MMNHVCNLFQPVKIRSKKPKTLRGSFGHHDASSIAGEPPGLFRHPGVERWALVGLAD